MKKALLILAVGFIVLLVGFFYFFNKQKTGSTQEQIVLEQTLKISQKYSSLRYRTENVLEKSKEYQDYDKWNKEMSAVIDGWKTLESSSMELEKEATKIANKTTAFSLVKNAHAYDSVEIQKVIESAPMGKQVRTLAQHLGVDAKMAQLILNQTQDQVTREAYGEEGDVFETCEQNSMRIKNGAKVTVFVGGVVLTGGTSAIAASGALAKTTLVVSGADLVLEVADDEAKIALGDKNKVSEMVGSLRVVTEPAAGILTIANMPGNLSKAMEKISAAYFGADQVRSAIQDEKILGISIKINKAGETKASIAGLTQQELPEWMKENNVVKSGESVEEILNQAEKEIKDETRDETKEEKQDKSEEKKEAPASENNIENIPNQIYKVVNVSGESYMMDVCHTPTCWDDLAANPAKDRDLGGIYTMGKVFGNGESFKNGFHPIDLKKSNRLVETSANSYKMTVYFAIAPFEGPKNKTIDYGTWQSHSIEISANYGDEPIIEWDGSSLKQIK
ncbi:MAG: hypothetical protein RBS77_04170 [Candidatus Moranbacteria bacterium]|jgi:hypothetical protein|nr:hypothetical protein [Candidatus Moranbacteria bacterium]